MKHKNFKGFTLVELLIVIALIAILSVAVLATLNPAEQANKGRDARVQNDAAEILGAYERYYAAKTAYPWNYFAGAVGSTNVVLRSDKLGFGVCGKANLAVGDTFDTTASACDPSATATAQNVLVTTGELKSTVLAKDEFEPVRRSTNKKVDQALWAVKPADSELVSVCYVPKSLAARNDTANLKCITEAGVVSNIGTGCTAPTSTEWSTATSDPDSLITSGDYAVFKCVP